MKKLFALPIFIISLFLMTSFAHANKGVIQMEAADGGKCFVFSNLMADFNYKLLVDCVGHQYPPGPGLFQYVSWADHGEGEYSYLGTLGVGSREYTVARPYNRMVITKEAISEPENPSNNVYMVGSPQVVAFMNNGNGVDLGEATTIEPDPTQTPQASPLANFDDANDVLNDNQPAGIGGAIRILAAIVVVVVVVIVAIAFISASRRKPIDI